MTQEYVKPPRTDDPRELRIFYEELCRYLNAVTASMVAADHGLLTGLDDDDHEQYHTDARGDARYYTQTEVDTAIAEVTLTQDEMLTELEAINDGVTDLTSSNLSAIRVLSENIKALSTILRKIEFHLMIATDTELND